VLKARKITDKLETHTLTHTGESVQLN